MASGSAAEKSTLNRSSCLAMTLFRTRQGRFLELFLPRFGAESRGQADARNIYTNGKARGGQAPIVGRRSGSRIAVRRSPGRALARSDLAAKFVIERYPLVYIPVYRRSMLDDMTHLVVGRTEVHPAHRAR